jgi:endonuclease/exonuclease/phosphatase family metal-dependent hydrolase
MFLDAVTKIVAEEKGSAVLLPGDFNAQPDEPTYKLISNGTLP